MNFFVLKYTSVKAIAELCKGSTADSDSVCLGSNPSSAAKEKQTILGWSVFLSFGCVTVASYPVVVPRATTRVRIPRPKIGKLACQAKGEGIFALSEYPSSATII